MSFWFCNINREQKKEWIFVEIICIKNWIKNIFLISINFIDEELNFETLLKNMDLRNQFKDLVKSFKNEKKGKDFLVYGDLFWIIKKEENEIGYIFWQ